jgi:integrase
MASAGTGRRGSIRQAASGTWFFVVDVTQPGGERRQTRRRGFATRRDAQRELTRVLASVDDRVYVEPKRQTLAMFLTEAWLPAVQHTIKPSTFESYSRNIRIHVVGRPIGRRRLQQVGPADLNALYAQLLVGDEEHRPLSARSVAYVATILHHALRDAVRWHAIVRNSADAADPPRPTNKPEMRFWKAQELAQFLAGVADDRLSGAWWLLATTGMRRGEVLGLRWQDVDLDAGRLTISRTLVTTDVQRKGEPGFAWGTPKTGKGRRQVALDPSTVAALRSHRTRQRQERLAAERHTTMGIWSAVLRMAARFIRRRSRTTSAVT